MEKSKLSPIEQYYESIVEKVNNLIDANEFDKANEIINDELEASYIPIRYQEILENLSNQVTAEINYFQKIVNFENMNKNELIDFCFQNQNFNSFAFHLLFEKYNQSLTNDDFEVINDFLRSKKNLISDKHLVMITLSTYQIDFEFCFYNKFLNKNFNINPKSKLFFDSNNQFVETQKILADLTEKEPSIFEFCNSILKKIHFYYFPNNYKNLVPKDLAFKISNYILKAFGNNSYYENNEDDINKTDEEFDLFINKILEIDF